VHDPRPVEAREGGADLGPDARRDAPRQPPFASQGGLQGHPFEELHHQVGGRCVQREVIERDEVRVRRARRRFGFSTETLPTARVVGEVIEEHLDRDAAP